VPRCNICKGSGIVYHCQDSRGEDTLTPSFGPISGNAEMGYWHGQCPQCDGTGIGGDAHPDFDRKSVGICLPPDDDGTIGDRFDVYLERCRAVGSEHSPHAGVQATIEFVTGSTKQVIVGFSRQNLRDLGRHLIAYADRMRDYP
jgi:hypothetical protein